MANSEHLEMVRHKIDAWNARRASSVWPNDLDADLSGADLHEADLHEADLRGANLSKANLRKANLHKANLCMANLSEADLDQADFSGANLSRANVLRAKLFGPNFSGANLYDAYFKEATLVAAKFVKANLSQADLSQACFNDADFSGANLRGADLGGANLLTANFSGANLIEAKLNHSVLSQANLSGANLRGANLEQASLVETNFTDADLTGCRIYGISAWNVVLSKKTKQQNLIITAGIEPEITVDDIEVAQFLYLLINNEKIRKVIDTISSKAVLILGRFTPKRKPALDMLREQLRRRDRTPIVFDFKGPSSKNITDTVKLLAQMARYIIVDLSDPNSAPYELGVISMLGLKTTPVVPIIVSTQKPFSMIDDVLRERWSTGLITYRDLDDLRHLVNRKLVNDAESKLLELRGPQTG